MSNKLIFILAIIIMFNFISIPKQSVHAVDPLTLTLGALYTYEVAQALYLTILTATAIGVTFATIEEWKNFHDMLEGTSPGPIEQYPEWEGAREELQQSKSDLATEHWFSQWELKSLPGGGEDPDPGNNKKGILAFMGASVIMGGFINKFISMFQKLEPIEGINKIEENVVYNFNDGVAHRSIYSPMGNGKYKLEIEIKSKTSSLKELVCENFPELDLHYTSVRGIQADGSFRVDIYYRTVGSSFTSNKAYYLPSGFVEYDDITDIELEEILNFSIKENSPILNDLPYNKTPQPNLIPIPRHNPSTTPLVNPDGTPKPGIQSIINPDGSVEDRYYGDIDDLIEYIVMNTPIDDILNPDTRPYEIEPGPGYIKITYPDLDPTVPFPQPGQPLPPGILPGQYPGPGPYPFPNPSLPPGILPGQYPGPGPYPGLPPNSDPVKPPGIEPGQYPGPGPYPFPDPSLPPGIEPGQYPGPGPYPWLPPNLNPNPNPSPQTPVEPGTMIDYTSWLQIIINWLSKILESINNIPNNLIDTITSLFVPQENYIGGKMDNINTIINSKLGQPDGTPLLGAFSLIDCEYIENQKGSISLPCGISQEVDFVNTDRVNSMAQTIRDWQRFLWWVTIVLISMNNIYKLVRGTDLITIKGPEGTGWGSAGRKARGGG